MKADHQAGKAALVTRGVMLLTATLCLPSLCLPSLARAGVKVAEQEGFTLELGMRLQPRLEYTNLGSNPSGWVKDFMVRRARLKANGKMLSAVYGFEWKIDGTDQVGASPSAAVENAWVQIPLGGGVDLKAGLYDQPFSRDRLTSDSRQLAVDRGLVSNVPDALGLADNVTGVEVLGKAGKGKVSYWAGLFDNRFIPGPIQDTPMVCGRVDLNLGSTSDIYQDAHFGTAKWVSFGVNGSYQPIDSYVSGDSLTIGAAGVDGMVDLPTGPGRLLVRAEASTTVRNPTAPGRSLDTHEWMVGAGLLMLHERLQPFIRFDEVRSDNIAQQDVTYVGMNLYQKGHSLKFQGDLQFRANTDQSLDGGRLQAQIDF